MTLTVMKKSFQKHKQRIINFQRYKYFENNAFREELLSEILNFNFEISDKGFSEFFEACSKH